ncbi:MAG: hypothetical protein K6G27_06265, partial [Lachnospiraceae bacterium]|nr:hypothetical protein [Lachnospiraceae bacterium]
MHCLLLSLIPDHTYIQAEGIIEELFCKRIERGWTLEEALEGKIIYSKDGYGFIRHNEVWLTGEERRIHYPNDDLVYSLSVIFTSNEYDGIISDQDSEVLEHRFFGRDEIPEELFPADSRA